MARLGREDALPSGESRSAGAIPSRLLWFPRGRSIQWSVRSGVNLFDGTGRFGRKSTKNGC